MVEKSLVMTFATETGAKVSIVVKDIKENLTEDACNEAMDSIIAADIIKTPKGLLKTKEDCELVTREVTEFSIA